MTSQENDSSPPDTPGPQAEPAKPAPATSIATGGLPSVELGGSPNEGTNTQEGFESLSPKYVVFEKRTNLIAAAVVLTIGAAILFPTVWVGDGRLWMMGLATIAWILVAGLLVFAAIAWPPLAYRHIHWRINQDGMEIRRGVLWRHRVSIPVARVQHVDVSQGPVARMFDLGKLTIHTAGTKNASIELDGLPHARALQVRDQLIRQKESLDVL